MAEKCVHKACGKSFTDPEEECVYHPGPPVFHEGQKGKYLGVQTIPYPCRITGFTVPPDTMHSYLRHC